MRFLLHGSLAPSKAMRFLIPDYRRIADGQCTACVMAAGSTLFLPPYFAANGPVVRKQMSNGVPWQHGDAGPRCGEG